MKKNILIVGITGFLGRNLLKFIDNSEYNIFGTYNSDYRFLLFNKNNSHIRCKKLNLSSENLQQDFENILFEYKINYVIHTAAMKYVNICEFDIIEAVKINILATDHIIHACKRAQINNLIVLSTDKTILPKTIYGYTKLIMEQLVLQNNFSIFQGVNFFGSDGSVLDCWYKQYSKNFPLTVYDPDNVRYFNSIKYVCEMIINNLDEKNKIIIPQTVYKISVKQILDAFCKHFNYENYEILGSQYLEKQIEDLNSDINIIIPDHKTVTDMISNFFAEIYD